MNLLVDFSTLDSLPIFAMVADASGKVVFFNRYWHDYTGQPREESGAYPDWDRYVHPADVESVAEQWQRALANEADVVEIHHRVYHQPTGTYRWIQTRATPIRDAAHSITHWLGLAMDVEEHHRAVELSADLATKLQELYAPSGLPVTETAYFSAWYEPAHQRGSVGGDWCKAIRLDDDRVLFAVGDVAGHGLEAAIMMGRARQAVLTVAANDETPAIILQRANRALALQETVATCAVGILRPSTREITLAVAGNWPPILIDSQGTTAFVGSPGLSLGIEKEARYSEHSFTAGRGATLILFTDGLVEFTRNIIEGQRRIVQIAKDVRKFVGPNLAQEFAARVLGGAMHDDDIAVLAIAF